MVIAMWLGTNKRLLKIKVKDLSYGIFLYGWPIGQIVYEIIPMGSALVAALLTINIATLVAYISKKIISIIIAQITKVFKNIITKSERSEEENGR